MSEEFEAARDGATLQKNSGRGSLHKGDAILEEFLIDYKEYAKGFTVSIDALAKLNRDAITAGNKIGVFKLILGEGINKQRVWVLPEYIMEEYLNAR